MEGKICYNRLHKEINFMLDTLLFDLDDTLVPFVQDDFIQAYFHTLVRRLAPMGYDGGKLTRAIWAGTAAMVQNDGQRTNRQVFWEVFTQQMGLQSLALESILEDFYVRDFDGVRSVLTRPVDRSGLIRGLRRRGYCLVLATNPIFPAVAVETRLRWVGLTGEDFSYVTTYENSRHSKPNPDYYRDILSVVGRQGCQCLMVGNNPVDDMAALEAGLGAYLVTDYLENPENRPIGGYTHGTFQELKTFLNGLPGVGE